MAFTKITSSDLANKGVIGLPDVPGLSTSNMQIKLEETARDVIIPKHNGLIDELEANTGASNIGATAPTGLVGTNVQSLIDDLNLKKENNSSALASTDTAEANDTFNIRKLTTTYKIAFSDLVNSIKAFIGSATSSAAGFFSAEDKTKLDGIEANANDYSLPIASSSELGGIKVGNNLQIAADGTLSATGSGSGDMTKAVYDTNDNGIVDAAESVPWSGVTSKPTTLAGYGITDAYTKTEVDSAIPNDLADLNSDSTHRLVTDSEKTTWSGKISNAYKRVTVGATNVDASGEDALEIEAGTGMTITADTSTKKIVFASTGGGTTDAYKTIRVGSTDIVASGADTFEIKAGSNVTLTPDTSGKSVTINASGGGQSTGDMLAADYDPNFDVKNTTGGIPAYVAAQIPSVATTSTDGLMSSSDKSKLNGIASGAEVNVQSDWNISDSSSDAFIQNKPTIPSISNCYQSTDTAETTLADGDYFPFYDTSASAKRKTLWSNIKSGLKAYFDTLYSTIKTLAGLTDTTISSPVSGQILEYDGSKWVNGDNIKEFARFGGSKTFAELTSSLLTAANVDKFFLVTDGGTIASADAGNWVLPAGSVIPADAHIAVIEYSAGVYKFDDFGGYIDISGKADKTQLDGWTATSIVQSDNTVTFTGLNDAYGYDLFCNDKLIGTSAMTKTGSGTNTTLKYTVTGAASGDVCKLRILK